MRFFARLVARRRKPSRLVTTKFVSHKFKGRLCGQIQGSPLKKNELPKSKTNALGGVPVTSADANRMLEMPENKGFSDALTEPAPLQGHYHALYIGQ
jgi:hypothetical protein